MQQNLNLNVPLLSSPPPSPLLLSFNGCVEGIRDWLKQMDLSLKSEHVLGAESQQGASEELERMENLHKELLARRCVYLGV